MAEISGGGHKPFYSLALKMVKYGYSPNEYLILGKIMGYRCIAKIRDRQSKLDFEIPLTMSRDDLENDNGINKAVKIAVEQYHCHLDKVEVVLKPFVNPQMDAQVRAHFKMPSSSLVVSRVYRSNNTEFFGFRDEVINGLPCKVMNRTKSVCIYCLLDETPYEQTA